MEKTCIIPVDAKEALQKKLVSLQKKAKTYGKHLEWEFGEETVVTRKIYNEENEKVGEEKVFGVAIAIESDIIRNDGYTVVAEIEHCPAGNIVTMFDEDSTANPAWYSIEPHCEHCHKKIDRRYTYMIADKQGVYKQVGKACLRDYCGIDPKMVAAAMEITDLIAKEYSIDDYDFEGCYHVAFNTLEVIAMAYDITKEHGYVKSCENNSTKNRLFTKAGKLPSEAGMKFAEEMKEELTKADYDELPEFLRNIKSMIQAQYIRQKDFGYIAYSPIAFQNMIADRVAKESGRKSEYIGNVGERITVEVQDMKYLTSFETIYGCTHLFKFVSGDNILMWYASKYIDEKPKKITGTIKAHKEYDGQKQTVLSRVKFA